MFEIRLTSNIDVISRSLDDLASRNLAFATARALTELAKEVRDSERAALPGVFDRPTPFTMNSFGVKVASKRDLTAEVFAKPVAAQYLSQWESGGERFIVPGRGDHDLVPTPASVNSGGVPRGYVARGRRQAYKFVGFAHLSLLLAIALTNSRPNTALNRRCASALARS